jgi:hypothetical protein
MNTDKLKQHVDMLEKQAHENEEAANGLLKDEDSLKYFGKKWTVGKAEELHERARSARKLAAEIKSKISS